MLLCEKRTRIHHAQTLSMLGHACVASRATLVDAINQSALPKGYCAGKHVAEAHLNTPIRSPATEAHSGLYEESDSPVEQLAIFDTDADGGVVVVLEVNDQFWVEQELRDSWLERLPENDLPLGKLVSIPRRRTGSSFSTAGHTAAKNTRSIGTKSMAATGRCFLRPPNHSVPEFCT